MEEDIPAFVGHRSALINYPDCKKESARFWQFIRGELQSDEISAFDSAALQTLCTNENWMDLIPKGLVTSYSYLYHCVKGLGCEDAETIEKDVLRTVGVVKDGPKVFSDTSEHGKAGLARSMHRVLTAISITDSMGYCQGMNYVVDFLLKMTSEEETFTLFLYALRNKHLCSLYETKLPVLSEFMEIFELHLTAHLPALSNHLLERGFIAPFYSIEWFTTLFTLASPFDMTVAVWDMFFAGVQDAQLRCALAFMEILEPLLLKMTTEELLKEFRYLCLTVTREDVVIRALKIQLGSVRLGGDLNGSRTIEPKYKEERYTDTLLCLRAQYLTEAKTAMQERDIDNGRWVKQRKSEKYEKRKQRYLEKKRQRDLKELHSCTPDDIRKRISSLESERYSERFEGSIGSNYPGLAREVSFQQHPDGQTVSDGIALVKEEDILPPRDLPNPETLPQMPNSSENMETENDIISPYNDTLEPNKITLASMNSFLSSDNSFETPVDASKPPEEVDSTDEDDEIEEDITASYEVYFDFLVSPTLLSYANLLKQIIVKCDRISSWNQLNQVWLETLPHIKNNLAKYNFADYMLRYSIQSNAHLRVIEFFFCIAGSDPNSQDRWLRTPLHYAVVYNRPDVIRLALLIGSDPNIPGAICVPNLHSSNPNSSQVHYNLYTAKELLLTLNNSSSPSLTILKEKCCIWCQKIFHIPSTPQQSSSAQLVKTYCGLCSIPFCLNCIQRHRCVYSIDKNEYLRLYIQQCRQKEYLKPLDPEPESNEKPHADNNLVESQSQLEAVSHDVTVDNIEVEIDKFYNSPKNVSHHENHSVEVENLTEDFDERCSADENSDHLNGRDSLDSGFGSADEVKPNPTEELVDNIEEYYDSEDQNNAETGSLESDNNEETTFGRMSLPFKNFLGKKRSSSKQAPTGPTLDPLENITQNTNDNQLQTPGKNNLIVRTSDEDNSDLVLRRSSINSPGFFPWRKNSQVQIESEENTLTSSVTSDSNSSGMSVFSRARSLTIDVSRFTGDKKDKSKKLIPTSQAEAVVSPQPGTEKKKKLGMLSSIKKLTKGITLTHHASDPEPPNLVNDEPVPKFTIDGVPLYWIGYRDQEAQFVLLQAWQILLLPILFHTERYYEIDQSSELSFQYNRTPCPSGMTSPISLTGPSIHPHIYLLDGPDPTYESSQMDQAVSETHPIESMNSFTDYIIELEQNQPNYLYFKSDMSSYYSLLMKDAELFTIDIFPPESTRSRNATNQSNVEMKDESFLFVSPQPESDGTSSPVVELLSQGSSGPALTRTKSEGLVSQQNQQTSTGLTELIAQHLRILKYLQSSSWSLHEGDPQWAPNDCSWYCRTCYSQFSLFQRKHHCRRCGEVFCDDHAPKIEVVSCVPEVFMSVLQCIPSSDLPDKKQLRICLSCQNEMKECISLLSEYKSLSPMYTFEFWLETISKASLQSSASAINGYLNEEREEQPSENRNGLERQASNNENNPGSIRALRTTEVGLWMDTMADWIWRDKHPTNS